MYVLTEIAFKSVLMFSFYCILSPRQLTMCARPDGPSYEVMLRGETVEKTLDDNKPNFLVNRHFISWGGVPIGRAL